MTGYTWDLAHLHWNCTKLISYWSCRSTVVQFYPQDQTQFNPDPSPINPHSVSFVLHKLYQTHPFPSKWAAFTTLGHIPDFGSANFPPYLIGTLKVSGTCKWCNNSTLRILNGMINFHGENPGAVSILHRDDKSNHLANGVGSDGSELCSVTLIMLNRIITKSAGRLQTSPTDIAGTVGNVRKWCNNSTLRILNVRKFQFCFHLTHWDSKASVFATAIWNEINLYNNKCVEASFSSMRARYFGRSLVFLEWVNSFATPCWGNTAQCLGEKRWFWTRGSFNFPSIWAAFTTLGILVEPSKKVLHGAFPVCRSPTGLM